MFDITPNARMDTTEKLLYNIMFQNNKIIELLSKGNKQIRSCGGTHDNKGQQLACAKKKKKEGVKK